MSNKHVDLFKDIIPAVDLNVKELWDATTDEGRKEIKGDMWNLNRYISSVKHSSRDLQEHFVLTVNEYYNKNWNALQKEDAKLLWFLLCMCSVNDGKTYFHEWIPTKRMSSNKKIPMLLSFFPTMKEDEIELLAKIMTDKEFKELAKDHGIDDATIKKIVK